MCNIFYAWVAHDTYFSCFTGLLDMYWDMKHKETLESFDIIKHGKQWFYLMRYQ